MRATRPAAAPDEAAVIEVRMVGTRETPTTMEIMIPISTATSVRNYLPDRLRQTGDNLYFILRSYYNMQSPNISMLIILKTH